MTEEHRAEKDAGAFARDVIKLFRWNISDEARRRPFVGNASREVRQCANGLALLRQLLDDFMRRNTLSGTAIAESGIADAYAILDHLTTGKAHAVAQHINGLHSEAFRPQHAPANEYDRLVQLIVVGATRAIRHSDNIGLNEAARTIACGLRDAGSEYTPTYAQIRGWHYAFVNKKGGKPDVRPDFFMDIILDRAKLRGTSVLAEGLNLIVEHTLVAQPV